MINKALLVSLIGIIFIYSLVVYFTKSRHLVVTEVDAPKMMMPIFDIDKNPPITIDLSDRALSEVPPELWLQTSASGINLSKNKLIGDFSAQISKFSSLKSLDLSHNLISSLPKEIGNLKELQILNVADNRIATLPAELISLSSLKLLDVSGNKIKDTDISRLQASLPDLKIIK